MSDAPKSPGGAGERWLEAVRHVATQFALAEHDVKPCVAALLDGNLGGASRHEAAFTLAIECRRMGLTKEATRVLLHRWAAAIGYSRRSVERPIESAFRRNPNGEYKYHPPGLHMPEGGVYARVLGPFCLDVDCPRHCAPFTKRRGADFRDEGFTRFRALGWPQYLRSRRYLAAVETYRAICWREEQIEWPPGSAFHVTHEQLADRSGGNRRSVARHLVELGEIGLITYDAGSGEKGKKRRASTVRRVVPVPPAPPIPAIRDRGRRAP